jgi:hypothetical protein
MDIIINDFAKKKDQKKIPAKFRPQQQLQHPLQLLLCHHKMVAVAMENPIQELCSKIKINYKLLVVSKAGYSNRLALLRT